MIKFYFDFTSPYSYLAWQKIKGMNELTIKFIPVMVGKIISNVGSIGPGEVAPKREYLFKDCLRKAHERGLRMKAPATLPFNPLPFLRMVCALAEKEQLQKEFIDACFNYGWRDGLCYEDFDKFKEFILTNTKISEQEYEAIENDKLARKTIKLHIQMATDEGVFGVPSFKIDDELFWGEDSIAYLEKYLEGVDPMTGYEDEFVRFKTILSGENDA